MNVLELFPCSGGMAEGFRRAGIHVSLAFDVDPDACDSYEKNLGHRPICLDVRDLERMVDAEWSPGPPDLLVADPPCTPWSRAGKRRGIEDERDMLRTTVSLIAKLRPRAYLIGNVPGLDDSTNWHVVQEYIGGLSAFGYCVADFKSLDAADYGVPQHRVRPFWFGHLDGPCLRWPERTHGSPGECGNHVLPGTRALVPWVTVRQALGHLPREQLGTPVRLRWRDQNSPQHGSVASKPARVVGTSNLSDGNVLVPEDQPRRASSSALPRASDLDAPAGVITTRENGDGNIVVAGRARRRKTNHRPSHADEPAKTLTKNTHSDGALVVNQRGDGSVRDQTLDAPAHTVTAAKRGNEKLLLENAKHPINRPDAPSFTVTTKGDGRGAQGACVVEWPCDRPSTTVTTREAVPPPGHHPESGSILTMPGAVKLSEVAAGILQGFPEGWLFSGDTKKARWAQIGQAMPPGLSFAVASSIAAWFGIESKETAA